MVVNWQAPSLGGVDLWVSYAPNSADAGLDDSVFTDTFAIGGQISAGDMVFSAGFENASVRFSNVLLQLKTMLLILTAAYYITSSITSYYWW